MAYVTRRAFLPPKPPDTKRNTERNWQVSGTSALPTPAHYTPNYAEILVPVLSKLRALDESDNISLAQLKSVVWSYCAGTTSLEEFLTPVKSRKSSPINSDNLRKMGLRVETKAGIKSITTLEGQVLTEVKLAQPSKRNPNPEEKFLIEFLKKRLRSEEFAAGKTWEQLRGFLHSFDLDVLHSNDVGPSLASRCLARCRHWRHQDTSTSKAVKGALGSCKGKANTMEKFQCNPPLKGLTVHFGSGNATCLSKLACDEAFCVDPLFDGLVTHGMKGSHLDYFHKSRQADSSVPKLAVGEPGPHEATSILSDACAYEDAPSVNKGKRKTRSMCPSKTNELSADIAQRAEAMGFGGRIILKFGCVTGGFPKYLRDRKFIAFAKQRFSNLEFVAELLQEDDPRIAEAETLDEINERLSAVILHGNKLRFMCEEEGLFPHRTYDLPDGFYEALYKQIKEGGMVNMTPPPQQFICDYFGSIRTKEHRARFDDEELEDDGIEAKWR